MRNLELEPPAKSKMAARGPKNGQRGLVIGRCDQLSQNKFFDQSTPSMRKGRDGNREWKKKIMVKIAVH